MIFGLHYFLQRAGHFPMNVAVGVYMQRFTNATQTEVALVFLTAPIIAITLRPLLCSIVDNGHAHKKHFLFYILLTTLGVIPFVSVPFLSSQTLLRNERLIWYLLLCAKIIVDIGRGVTVSIADALVMNYAVRTKTEYAKYRKWSTISRGVFGFGIGFVNEVSFLPLYTPGFMIMFVANIVQLCVIYLWPDEYFRMVHSDDDENKLKKSVKNEDDDSLSLGSAIDDNKKQQSSDLMTSGEILTEMKHKLSKLFCASSSSLKQQEALKPVVAATNANKQAKEHQNDSLSKTAQLLLILKLVNKDKRIVPYLLMALFVGFTGSLTNFFFVYLADVCTITGQCNFSSLAGVLQISSILLELLFFVNIKSIKAKTGRVYMYAIGVFVSACRFLFYGSQICEHSTPYLAILIESIYGLSTGTVKVVITEAAHEFANETKTVLNEQDEKDAPIECANGKDRGISKRNNTDADTDDKQKFGATADYDSDHSVRKSQSNEAAKDTATGNENSLVLAATMQATFSIARDGIGKGIGTLTSGLLIDYLSFTGMWLVIGSLAAFVAVLVTASNFVGTKLLKLHLKPRSKARAKACNQLERV